MNWSKRFRKAATRMATIIALAGCLAAQTANWVTARSTVKVYDQPLEKHFLYYSRGQAVDNIAPGERFLVKEHRIVQTALGPQTWYQVQRQSGKLRVGWIDSADLNQKGK